MRIILKALAAGIGVVIGLAVADSQAQLQLGVSIDAHDDPFHFGPDPTQSRAWPQMAAIGAKWVRNDWNWNSVETGQDASGNPVYSLPSDKLYYATTAKANGLKSCFVVQAGVIGSNGVVVYSPTRYTDHFDPVAYPKACAALVSMLEAQGFKGTDFAIEVLNEPNNYNDFPGLQYGSQTTAGEQRLVTLTTNTTNAVHAVDPTVQVVGLGCQGQVILDMLAMAPVLDGVVVHPYDDGSHHPEAVYEPPYKDYEGWLAVLEPALPANATIWETEFAEDGGTAAGDTQYVRANWLTRRLAMSSHHPKVTHWFVYTWVTNVGQMDQQFMEWTALDPGVSFYALQRLFAPTGLFTGAVPVSTLPTITGADTTIGAPKGYVFNGQGVTLCPIWYGGSIINSYDAKSTPVTVSFPTTLTSVGGSYVMSMVGGDFTASVDPTAITVSLSGGVATVSGLKISTEAQLIVLAPGTGGGPTPTPTPTPTPPAIYQTGQNNGYPTVTLTKPEQAGDTIVVKTQSTATSVTDNAGNTYVQTSPGVWKASNIKGLTWLSSIYANGPATSISFTEYIGSFNPGATPTPSPSATPTPTPSGIQPAITLPTNYTLVWNQDFTLPAFNPFNVPAIVTLNGPTLPVPGGSIFSANRNFSGMTYTGTDGFPFSTGSGALVIHMFPSGSGTLGGILVSAYPDSTHTEQLPGFMVTNGYWEAKIKVPSTGTPVHSAFWVTSNGSVDANGVRLPAEGEIDIMEFGVQVPGQPGTYQIHLHNWPGGSTAGDVNNIPLSVTTDGYHVFGCLVQPLTVSCYLDGKLVQAFSVGSGFNTPMAVLINVSNDNSSSTLVGDMACQYIRVWAPPQ